MREKLRNLDDVVKKLKNYLGRYLQEHEIDITKNFMCINPKHDDTNASMTCTKDPDNAFCFGCGLTADIFQAVHWLENKPLDGPNFIDIIKYLADKYAIELELEDMSEEEMYRYRTYRAYADAAKLIANPKFGNYKEVLKEAKKREWKKLNFEELKIGTVNYRDFRDTLRAMGYEPRFQDEIDLGRPDIFDETNLIFTISDEWGRPVGFAARNLLYKVDENGKPNGSKYKNQKTTGVKCNIYQKNKRLYQIHEAKRFTPPLYIFEGYIDVITAAHHGLSNCVAIGGTAFSDEHINLLKRLNITDIVLVLDGDKAGQEKTRKLLDEKLRGQRDLRISVINLPNDLDPDDFFRANGLEEFLKLKKWSAFEWRLDQYPEDADAIEVCNTMIPLIVNESSYILQDQLCEVLSRFTGIDKSTIKSELERLQNQTEREKQKQKDALIDNAMLQIKQNPGNERMILHECAAQIEQVEDKYNENALSQESFITFVETQKEHEEKSTGDFVGFHLSPLGLGMLGENLNGNWREDVFKCYGGSANTGKTSFLVQLAYEIASNDANNATVIYHTIDDSSPQILPRLVVQSYGGLDLTINQVRNPKWFVDQTGDKDIYDKRNMGYRNLIELAKEGKIILKDANDGASFAFGESLIAHAKKRYPGRHIVYILDNLHKTPDYAGMEPRLRFKTLSNHLKDTATRQHACIVASVEYTKLPPATIPHNNNIAETRAIIYDASFIGHMYNDIHEVGPDDAILVHKTSSGDLLPRVRLGIGKNKITDFKDRIFLDMYPASGIFRAVAPEIAKADQKTRIKEIRLRRSGKDDREEKKPSNNFESDGDAATW